MSFAREVNLGNNKGGDYTTTQVALRLLPKPELWQVKGIDVGLEGGVAGQLPLHPAKQTAVPLSSQVLLKLTLTRAVRLAQLAVVNPGGDQGRSSGANQDGCLGSEQQVEVLASLFVLFSLPVLLSCSFAFQEFVAERAVANPRDLVETPSEESLCANGKRDILII